MSFIIQTATKLTEELVQVVKTAAELTEHELVQVVHDAYSAKATSLISETYSKTVAHAFGYTPAQLQAIPLESHMGLGCGNPVAAASIKEGETVLDLGSGGGVDVFLAAAKAGIEGKVIGLDMSEHMIRRARNSAEKQNLHPPEVEFIQAFLTETFPVATDSVDWILSNCVINLLPPAGKINVLKEALRVLKSGGRIVFVDLIAKKPLPEHIRSDLAAHVGCVAGAIEVDEYKDMLTTAGFADPVFVDTHSDINIYRDSDASAPGSQAMPAGVPAGCCSTSGSESGPEQTPGLESDFDANAWVAAYEIYALRP